MSENVVVEPRQKAKRKVGKRAERSTVVLTRSGVKNPVGVVRASGDPEPSIATERLSINVNGATVTFRHTVGDGEQRIAKEPCVSHESALARQGGAVTDAIAAGYKVKGESGLTFTDFL